MKPGFILVQDDSCHWYVIPEHMSAVWDRWWEDDEGREAPEWAHRINGAPSRVVFNSWRLI
jgi:hypothetical protein